MTARKDPERGQRKDLGHGVQVPLKLHPDLKAHVDARAEAEYCSAAEYIRRLIIADMRRKPPQYTINEVTS